MIIGVSRALSSPSTVGRMLKTCLCKASTFANDKEESASVSETKQSSIHPTAIVHPDAIIAEGVSIGPFCTVGSGARIGNSCQLHAGSHVIGSTELGDGCVLLTGAIAGSDLPGSTVIGSNNRIGHHAVIGVKCQDMKYKEGDECFLYMGNNNDVREFASIHRSSKANDRTVRIFTRFFIWLLVTKILSWVVVILLMTAKWVPAISLLIILFWLVMLSSKTLFILQGLSLFINFATLDHTHLLVGDLLFLKMSHDI